MFSGGKIHYEIGAKSDAMSYGGIGAMHRLVTKLGLPQKIDEDLHLLKVHLPYHESDHVLKPPRVRRGHQNRPTACSATPI